MNQSMYLRLAVFFVRMDIKREESAWRKAHRRIRYVGEPLSEHLMRDIGFEKDGLSIGHTVAPKFKAQREVARMRRKLRLNLTT
ncbi:hypothetical protein RN22_08340 [Grimontia sp. AD028]|uniref:DUF1127 domain-containing protein n=2 Tax=Grimontia TaxID=246861 RepID=A0A128EX31_9GAMM|nr:MULTISPECIES: hypothetical protein [Grimontia]EOD78447.1 hypothetical protein D515_02806 [Grimontia indica]KKD60891.1 hypothetical protein RN22_08340 [Grimontia sp. AD028]CZF79097.1 hypothetical protein GMA8713_00837 [Grimontia marina]